MIVLELIGRFVFGAGKALVHPGNIFVVLWCVFSAGMSWIMLSETDLPYIGEFQGALETTTGEVTEYEPAPLYDGEDAGPPLHAVRFKFNVNGKPYLGASYTRGNVFKPGQAVTIEYKPGDPHIARVQGTQSMPTDGFLWFILIFPAIGALMVVVTLIVAIVKGFSAAGEALRRA